MPFQMISGSSSAERITGIFSVAPSELIFCQLNFMPVSASFCLIHAISCGSSWHRGLATQRMSISSSLEASVTGTVKYYVQIHLQVWQNKVCTGQGNLPLITRKKRAESASRAA